MYWIFAPIVFNLMVDFLTIYDNFNDRF